MKKLIITSLCSVAVAGVAFSQGNINWTGPSAAAFTFQTNSMTYSMYGLNPGASTGGGAIGGGLGATTANGGYYFALLVGAVYTGTAEAAPTTLAGFSSWSNSGLQATNNPNGNGRTAVMSGNAGATVNALSTTVSNNIIMVGWSANLGTTWSTALATLESGVWSGNAFFGTSSVGYVEGADTSVSPGNSVFGTAPNSNGSGVPIFSLNTPLYLVAPVPEPGTLALAALGGASLLLFRRKK